MTKESMIKFPWWYTPVKWGLPLGIAFSSAALLAMILTGGIAVPPSLGALQWLPVIFKSLEGLASVAALLLATFATSCMAGFITATLVRAWILFPVAESRANLAHVAVQSEEAATLALNEARQQFTAMAKSFTDTLWNVTGTFNQRLGNQQATPFLHEFLQRQGQAQDHTTQTQVNPPSSAMRNQT